MNKTCFHVDDFDWQSSAGELWKGLRWKEMINRERAGSKEFIFGLAELADGAKLPLHKTRQAETGYILSGRARVRLGARSIELNSASAYYFPESAPRLIETLGSGSLRYVYTYACERLGPKIHRELVGEKEAAKLDISNLIGVAGKQYRRWAVSEDFEEWVPVEPSKGFKVRIKYLFDHRYGQKEMLGGVAEFDPGIHYTLHHHPPAEIYFVLKGRGIIYVKDSEFTVRPGSALYVGGNVTHGVDNPGKETLRLYWLYGTETVGKEIEGTPDEDIYMEVRRP